MKKNFFSTKMWLLLVGVMICFTGCTFQDDLDTLTDRVTALEGNLTTVNEQVESLKATAADLQSFDQKFSEEINNLKSADEAIDAKIKELAAVDSKLAADVQAVADLTNSNMNEIASLKTQLADQTASLLALQEWVARNEAAINANSGKIDGLENRMNTADEAFKALEGKVDKNKTDLSEYIKTVEDATIANKTAIETINTTMAEIEANLAAVKTQVDNLDQIFATDADVDGVKTEMSEQLNAVRAEMAEAINGVKADIESAVATINADMKALEERMNETFGEQLEEALAGYARLADYQATAAALEELSNKYDATAEEVKNLGGDIDAINKKFEELEALVATKASKEELAKVEADYKAAVAEALKAALENDGKITDDIKNQLNAAVAELNAKIAELEEAIKSLTGNYQALLGRIQSVVFVPEYSDGKATINYATIGGEIIEAQSVIKYQILPIDGVLALNKDNVSFQLSEALKTRSSNPSMEVVDVKIDNQEKGIIAVYVNTRNFTADFYTKAKNSAYAASLVIDNGTANVASSFTNLYPTATEMSIRIDNVEQENHRIQYHDTETVVDILPKHKLMFSVETDKWLDLAQMTAAGYAINYVQNVDTAIVGNDGSVFELGMKAREGYADSVATVKLNDVKESAVDTKLGVTYTYSIGTEEVLASDTVEVTRRLAKMYMSVEDIVWTYNRNNYQDALSDAGLSNTYMPNNAITIDSLVSMPAGDKYTYANIINSGIFKSQQTVTPEGKVERELTVTMGGTNEKPVVSLAWFEWGKEYTITRTYQYEAIEVDLIMTVNTVDRSREVIKLALKDETITLANKLEKTFAAEALTPVYEAAKSYLGNMTENEFFAMIINNYKDSEKFALSNTFNKKEATGTTGLSINGNKMTAHYSYTDFADQFAQKIEYVYDLTTWFGQQIIITKNVTIELPAYDFKYDKYHVYNDENGLYSKVTPLYSPEITSTNVSEFALDNVDMDVAFRVVAADDEEKYLQVNDAESSLVTEFNFATTDAKVIGDSKFNGNKLTYKTTVASIPVVGKLYIMTGNGEQRVELPTKFANEYKDYFVMGYDPIGQLSVVDGSIELSQAVTYYYNVWYGMKLKDYRNGHATYDLINGDDIEQYANTTQNGWVIGDGTNGYASNGYGTGMTAKNPALYSLNIKLSLDQQSVPTELVDMINFTEDGILSYDNTAMLKLTEPVELKVNVELTYPYGATQNRVVTVTISNK